MTSQTLFSRERICAELSNIFEADVKYIERLFKLGRISDLPPIDISKILATQNRVKFSDIFDQSALCICAQAIFIPCADEDDIEIQEMHAIFIANIIETYKDAETYGESIRERCPFSDILDYMSDQICDLQIEIDGKSDEESEDSDAEKWEEIEVDEKLINGKPNKELHSILCEKLAKEPAEYWIVEVDLTVGFRLYGSLEDMASDLWADWPNYGADDFSQEYKLDKKLPFIFADNAREYYVMKNRKIAQEFLKASANFIRNNQLEEQ